MRGEQFAEECILHVGPGSVQISMPLELHLVPSSTKRFFLRSLADIVFAPEQNPSIALRGKVAGLRASPDSPCRLPGAASRVAVAPESTGGVPT